MHCELVVPGLFSAPVPARLASLELLLARGRGRRGESQRLEGWLHDAFGLGEQPLAAGALTVCGAGGDAAHACWVRADPVHLRLMRDRLLLVPGAALAVSAEEARALCEALNRHFAGVLAIEPRSPSAWSARMEQEFSIDAECPLELAGREVDLGLPGGAGAARAHGLLNEAQMLLHAHPVNEAREARGEPAVNSLWLWGSGRAPRIAACAWQSVAADDPVALGLARLAAVRHGALPASADAWLARAPEDGRHLAVLDVLRVPLALSHPAECREVLERIEREWFAPLLAALRSGRVGMLSVHVPDGGESASFETARGDLRRFWRRPRALERYS